MTVVDSDVVVAVVARVVVVVVVLEVLVEHFHQQIEHFPQQVYDEVVEDLHPPQHLEFEALDRGTKVRVAPKIMTITAATDIAVTRDPLQPEAEATGFMLRSTDTGRTGVYLTPEGESQF